MNSQNQQDYTQYDYTMYNNESLLRDFFEDSLVIFRKVLETWEESRYFLPKLEYLRKNIGAIGRKAYTANKPGNGYNVLNHGDFHMRNLLLKNNAENRIEKLFFVSKIKPRTFGCVKLSTLLNRDNDL